MSLDYMVLCCDRPSELPDGWRYEGTSLAHIWLEPSSSFTRELEEFFGVDAAFVIGLNAHHSAAELVDALADRLAAAYRGVVWCDMMDEEALYDHREDEPRSPVPEVDDVVDRWCEWADPIVEERRQEAAAAKKRRDELYERAQEGEGVGERFDWSMDD